MTKDEALKLALKALERSMEAGLTGIKVDEAITALHQALEQPSDSVEQEPFAYLYHDTVSAEFANPLADSTLLVLACDRNQNGRNETPLYTAPPSKPWVSLTDEDIAKGAKQSWVDKQAFESAVWWAEGKLKEKNRG